MVYTVVNGQKTALDLSKIPALTPRQIKELTFAQEAKVSTFIIVFLGLAVYLQQSIVLSAPINLLGKSNRFRSFDVLSHYHDCLFS